MDSDMRYDWDVDPEAGVRDIVPIGVMDVLIEHGHDMVAEDMTALEGLEPLEGMADIEAELERVGAL